MRENDDRTFAKSPILVENVTGDEVVFRSLGTGKSTSKIFGNLLGNLPDIFGYYRFPAKNPDTLRIKCHAYESQKVGRYRRVIPLS